MATVTKMYNLVPVKGRWRSEAGKVTVGLGSGDALAMCHRLCGLSTYGIKAHVEMSTPAKFTFGYGQPSPFHGHNSAQR